MRLIRWSREAERLFGWKAEEVLGRRMEDFRWIYDEDKAQIATVSADLQTGANPQQFSANRNYRKDGSVVWCEWYNSSLMDESGKLRSIMSLVLDVTARKQAEAALKVSEQRLALAASGARIGIFERDLTTGKTLCTPQHAQLIGLTAATSTTTLSEEYAYRDWADRVHLDDLPRVEAELQRCVTENRPYETEYRLIWPDGSMHWLAGRGTVIAGARSEPARMLGIVMDIIERKQAEGALRASHASLQAANRELETFTYSVSHDLRGPLRGMEGFARILEDEHGAQMNDDARHCVQAIRDSVTHAGRLIEDLLTFSLLAEQALVKETVETEALVKSALDDLRPQYDGRRIEIDVRKLPDAHADRNLLKQVWVNLLSNALKFTRGRDPALIHIGHEIRDGVPVYFVQDNGTGFDMRYAHKLFKIFQRMHRQEEFEGTGVGLAIVQRIIARHGGRIWAQAAKNQGATFYFTLEAAAHE